jgi:hypothetical protein
LDDVKGRDLFLIHGGDENYWRSSEGCIVFSNRSKKARESLEKLLKFIGKTGETIIVWR